MQFRYTLRRGSRHEVCPNCEKKTFKPYVDGSGKEAGRIYGRCERINSCGYTKYPKDDKNDRYEPEIKPYTPAKPVEYISEKIVKETFANFHENVFYLFLCNQFGAEVASKLQKKYNIGTATSGGTIFWQQDRQGQFRTGKVIYYRSDGKRDKTRSSWFIHSKIRADFNFRQCFFGLHLSDFNTPIALCESEKTAILMSVFSPQYTWLATGGSEMINAQRINELPRLDKVFPDHNQFEKWAHKTRSFDTRQMDISVERAVEQGIIGEGSDILDLVLAKRLTINQNYDTI